MINLLPPDRASAIRYGRRNARLRYWLLGGVISIVILVTILFGGSAYLDKQSDNYRHEIDGVKKQLAAQNLTQVQKNADEISGDITVINQVLGQEIKFSSLMQDIGKLMPQGTVLSSLSLSSNVKGGLDLNAGATTSSLAAQIQVNLSDPSKDLFSKVDVVTVSCDQQAQGIYKCAVILRALFSKNASARYINVPKGNSP